MQRFMSPASSATYTAAGQQEQVPQSSREAIRSTVRNSLAYGISEQRGMSHVDALALVGELDDVRPYVPHLASWASEWAAKRGHARPGNAATFVRRWIKASFPAEFAHGRSRGGYDMLPHAWAPVIDHVDDLPGLSKKSVRQMKTDIARIARVAFRRGADGPSQLPLREVLEQWMADAGHSPASTNNAISAYRRASASLQLVAGPLVLVSYAADHHPYARNLRHMEEVDALVGDQPDGRRARGLTTIEILAVVAPPWANAYTEWTTVHPTRAATRKGLLSAIDRIVACLIRQGRQGLLLEAPLALFEHIDVTDELAGNIACSGGAAAAAALGRAAVQRRVPVLWTLLDILAPIVRERSPLTAKRAFYPPTLIRDTVALFYWMNAVYKPTFVEHAPERWSVIETQFRRLEAHLKATNDVAEITGSKDKVLAIGTITLPQLVCVGLPRFAAHVHALERKWNALAVACANKGRASLSHNLERRAYREYEARLEQYVALASFTADPLREKNGSNAVLGDAGEIRIDVAYDEAGAPLRILGVKSVYSGPGAANPAAALKVPDKDERTWTWSPAMIDFRLLLKYLMIPRRRRIMARGLLRTSEHLATAPSGDATQARPSGVFEYSLQADLALSRIALFVSPSDLGASASFGYAKGAISELYGRGLHFVCTTILGRTGIPAYDECGTGRWRCLFACHIARLHWGTYWFGVRGEDGPVRRNTDGSETRYGGKQIAMDATTDLACTIEEDYEAVGSVMRDRMRNAIDNWEHPRAYDQWMDRAYLLEEIDWLSESLPLPLHLSTAPAPLSTPRAPRLRRQRTAR
jgi:hypothetical protein